MVEDEKDYLDDLIDAEYAEGPDSAGSMRAALLMNSLVAHRKNNRITQEAIAGYLGVSRPRVAEMERDPGAVSLSRILAYAQAVGATFEAIAFPDHMIKAVPKQRGRLRMSA